MKTMLAGIVLGLALVAAPAAAGEKKAANQQDAPKDAKDNAASKSLRDLETANLLIQLGRREKHAESLIVAAQLLHKIQTKPLGVERVGSLGKAEAKTDAMAKDNSPKALVIEATKLSSAPHIGALAEATNKMLQEDVRGAVGGPKVDSFTIRAGETINWNPITFYAGEKAEVFIDNGVNGRMTLQIFDEAGNLVVQDSVPGSYFRCVWYPRYTGSFRVRLINHDTISFRCGMATN